MSFGSLKTLVVLLAMLIPLAAWADEFEDEFDAEKSAADKEEANQQESDQAIKDLLGDTVEEEPVREEKKEEKKEDFMEDRPFDEPAPAKKDDFADDFSDSKPKRDEPKKESVDDILGTKKKDDKKEKKPAVATGIKPIVMVKGGFNFGSYAKDFKQGLMYGSVDEGILGAEFKGSAVFAKATINLRTNSPLLLSATDGISAVQYNPLMDDNYFFNSIVNGMPYEVYGGMKLFDMLTIRAGKMIPTYGLLDRYQHLGVAVGTPLGTRPLLAVEGYIPETDAGFALGFDYALDDDSGITAELMMGTGVIPSIAAFWQSQKTMGLYFKGGYRSEMITAMLGFQYRLDYEGTNKKSVPFIGFGLGAIFNYAGFEAWLNFDYTMMQLLYFSARKNAMINGSVGGMTLSLAPAYNLSIDHGFIDKLQFGVRFDLNYGTYNNQAGAGNYLTWYTGTGTAKTYFYKPDAMVMRFGIGINLFAKEYEGVRSFAGISFMMQPQSQLVNMTGTAGDVYNYGFYNVGLQGGAEF